MERPRGMAVQHTVSVRERTSKARTTFPVGTLARVDGWCVEQHSPAFISRPSSLSIGLTSRHGTPAVTAVTAVRDGAKLLSTTTFERLGVIKI